MASFKSTNHRVGEFLGASLAADVARRAFSLTVDLLKGTLDALRRLLFAEVIEHQSCTHQQGSGIGEPFASDVRSGTMYGFEHGAFVADIRAGHQAQPSDKARSQVAHYVTVKIRQQEHVKLQGIHDDLHAGVVNDEFLVFDGGKLCGYRPDRFQEQAVRKLHDIGFVYGMNLFSAVAFGIFKRKFRNARGSFFGDDFQAFDDAGNNLMLEAGVQVLGVLADENQVHIFKVRLYTGHVFDRAQIGVKIEGLAKGHVDAGRAAGNGR